MSLTILADENIPGVEHYVGSLGVVARFSGRALLPEQLAGVDVLLVRSVTPVDARLLGQSDVVFVGTATSGVDHIDRDFLDERGIAFRYAPGSNAQSVVEYVFAAICGVADYLERVLAGGHVGIIGYGVIGKALAARLAALGIRYKVYDPWLDASDIDYPGTLEEVLASTVVTLHPELTDRQPWPSRHLLNAATLAQIPPDSLLINASRGEVVDNSALETLLARGAGPEVVLDVWEGEPAIKTALLRRVRFGTPHIAGYSHDGKLLATRMLVEGMAQALDLPWHDPGSAAGEPPLLHLDPRLTATALLRSVVSQRYDIAADDAALREISESGDSALAAAGFDRLRREYPRRREILGSRVNVGALGAAQQKTVRGLGCLTGSDC